MSKKPKDSIGWIFSIIDWEEKKITTRRYYLAFSSSFSSDGYNTQDIETTEGKKAKT